LYPSWQHLTIAKRECMGLLGPGSEVTVSLS
jgi:hypothetical protein